MSARSARAASFLAHPRRLYLVVVERLRGREHGDELIPPTMSDRASGPA